ncbi:hypothetical protein P691DRAFT_810224 [Macrolepiota fuliginosa MF-IS2]|uniref:Uncharacterized protein n=1 Tax=Macrolepiota fuliginosa MF-IS2 TaxID=1400762 RepID=A0A9P5X1E5_9AGAR|nr:hypothetical protein P691DRAFT_810224 [Macrolepiota fuliginosa MF-IS2]
MHTTRKRKRQSDHTNKRNHRQNDRDDNRIYRTHQHQPDQDPNLFVQAHEADLRRGPQAQELAKSLEVVDYPDTLGQEVVKQRIGSALIQWAGGRDATSNPFDQDEETISLGSQKTVKDKPDILDNSGIWVDRYDARLLLDALPDFTSPGPMPPSSPSGWSDLPSDTEETFFFSPEEAEDFRNEKRRRLLEQAHEERVKARLKEEEEEENEEAVDEDPWGGSDEEVRPSTPNQNIETRTNSRSAA